MRPLALTLGDPDGIGPEITGKAWTALRDDPRLSFALVSAGRPPDFGVPTQTCGWDETDSVFARALPVIEVGTDDLSATQSAALSIRACVSAVLAGDAAAVVTNPISKERLYRDGFAHPGHTEFLGELTDHVPVPYERGPLMMLAVREELRVALVSIHESLANMIRNLSPARLERAARVLDGALRTDFGIASPRIALCGLNPHAGESGSLGREELDVINPTAARLRAMGIDITDARPADTLFHAEARETYDAVLAMYHDQGLIPVKSLDFHAGVNVTLGLPIVRTSPDHGTAFDIVGRNLANANSLIEAIHFARRLSDNRADARAV